MSCLRHLVLNDYIKINDVFTKFKEGNTQDVSANQGTCINISDYKGFISNKTVEGQLFI